MADADVLPPVPPSRASLVGRFLMANVVNAGIAGTVGAGIGGLFGSLPGAVIGMTIGVVSAMVLTGRHYGRKDAAKWQEYEAQRQEFEEATGLDWPDERKSKLRKLKIVAGTALAVAAMPFFAVAVPATAYTAVAFYGSMLAGAYLLTRLRNRMPKGAESDDDAPAPWSRHPGMFGEPPWWGDNRAGPGPYGQSRGPLNGHNPWTGGRFGIAHPTHAAAA